MANVPPLFKNFGKSFKDLLEKKFETDRQVKVKTTTQNGVTFETTGKTNSKSSEYSGSFKTIYKRSDFGTFDLELLTDNKAKFNIENDQWRKGLALKVSGDLVANKSPGITLDAGYRRESAALSCGLKLTDKSIANVSAVFGYDGLAVGGDVEVDVKEQTPVYNLGAEYAKGSHTVTVKTADKLNTVGIRYLNVLNSDATVGGTVDYGIQNGAVLAGFVGSYNIEKETTVKGKVFSDQKATISLEQRLSNPRVRLGLVSEFDLSKRNSAPERFGLSLGFGEF